MDRLIDEIVQVRVSDAVAAASATSVNTAAVVGVTTKDSIDIDDTQVLYSQDAVEKAYGTGVKQVIILDPSGSATASGDVELTMGGSGNVVAKAKVRVGDNATTKRNLLKALASSFSADGYSAVFFVDSGDVEKLKITADNYGVTENPFAMNYNGTGFSGSPTVSENGVAEADIVKVTKSFFLEPATPGKLVCIPVQANPTAGNIADTLDDALALGKDANNREIDFYNVVIRLSSAGVTRQGVVALATALDEWCTENFKLGHIEVTDRKVAADAKADLSANPTKRVAIYFHDEASEKSEAAQLVAERCGNDPARGTWAHKTLEGLVADPISKDDFKDAQELGLNIYAKVAGVDRTYFGTTGTKTMFIDSVVKKDWLKFRTQEAIFNLLGSANNGDGVDFNDDGIPAVVAAMTDIFTIAQDSEHRYVLPNSWEITAPKYKDIPAEDKAVRNLPRVRAIFSIQESIHTVKTVELQVV